MSFFNRDENGLWTLIPESEDEFKGNKGHPVYLEACPRYLNILDPLFAKAQDTSEFEFLLSLLRIRGVQDAGWDPYEVTTTSIPSLVNACNEIKDPEVTWHLNLWIWGHIVEASEPYELLLNLVDVADGGRFLAVRFPPKKNGASKSPGEKINIISQRATKIRLPQVIIPLKEIWNKDLRNSVFHSDYSLFGDEVRTIRPRKIYHIDEIYTLVNRAIAYQQALATLYRCYISSYTEPTIIDIHPGFGAAPKEKAIVIVREGHGAIGLQSALTKEELKMGRIQFRCGRFTPQERELLKKDPTLSLMPRAE
jgi:hypothetical protein